MPKNNKKKQNKSKNTKKVTNASEELKQNETEKAVSYFCRFFSFHHPGFFHYQHLYLWKTVDCFRRKIFLQHSVFFLHSGDEDRGHRRLCDGNSFQ